MGKVTGLGGVFIKFQDPKAMNVWYKDVLGLKTNDYGVLFAFNKPGSKRGSMQLGTFAATSTYFGSDEQKVMLNFRVQGLKELLETLQAKAVKVLDEIETYEYGSFVHIEDPEGNRIELWEPVDGVFESSETFQDME